MSKVADFSQCSQTGPAVATTSNCLQSCPLCGPACRTVPPQPGQVTVPMPRPSEKAFPVRAIARGPVLATTQRQTHP